MTCNKDKKRKREDDMELLQFFACIGAMAAVIAAAALLT